jgi:hypothetical protein
MPRTIDLIRANKLPSNMMQFAAKGALSVPPGENIEILVHLARHNKIFGDLARMTLAGWDEKASQAAASDPKTSREVLAYLIAHENLRPALLPALLENPSVAESDVSKLAIAASRDSIETMLGSPRVQASSPILASLRSNPYLKPEEASTIAKMMAGSATPKPPASIASDAPGVSGATAPLAESPQPPAATASGETSEVPDESVSAYLVEHAAEIVAEQDKPFQAVGGVVDLLGADYFPVSEIAETPQTAAADSSSAALAVSSSAAAARSAPAPEAKHGPQGESRRQNTLQKINSLDVKGRIQLALKGNKEERSILIRDGTKVVALAVLDAPKLSDGEVEKFALQKNVLEAVLRQIPLKRRFMKNYIVVRNLVSNPRTPLDLSLGLMKHLLAQDLKNLSANKEISETVRKLALKMFKQKVETANKK